MDLLRNQDTSIIYWLQDLFEDASFVTVTSEYKDEELTLPTVALETQIADGSVFELGNPNIAIERIYNIHIYANNITQRNDYAYKIFRELNCKIPVYNYNEGFPPTDSPSRTGTLLYAGARVITGYVNPELVDKMYYLSTVRYTAVYDEYNN